MRLCLQVLFLVSDCWNLLRMPREERRGEERVVVVVVVLRCRRGERQKIIQRGIEEPVKRRCREKLEDAGSAGTVEKNKYPRPIAQKKFLSSHEVVFWAV